MASRIDSPDSARGRGPGLGRTLASGWALARAAFRQQIGVPSPTLLILEPTLRCNSTCVTCYNLDLLNAPGGELSVAAATQLASELPDLVVLMLSGGEPMLHPDLPGFVAAFATRCPLSFVSIPTNGVLPDRVEAVTDALCARVSAHVVVNLSIDGLYDQHDAIRRVPGNFERIGETYERLVGLARRHANLHVSANTCVCAHNRGDWQRIVDWVRERWPAVEGRSICVVRTPGTPDADIDAAAFLAENAGTLSALTADRPRFRLGLTGRLSRRFWRAYYAEAHRFRTGLPRRWTCSAGTGGALYVDGFGNAHPCELLPASGKAIGPAGTLTTLLRSPAARAERRRIAQRLCSCDHSCFHQHSAFTELRNFPQWLRPPARRP